MQRLRRQSIAVRVVAAIAVIFGVATIKAGGSVLFGGIEAARAAGNFVPFVVWFNFLAGFVYIAAGVGLWVRRRWAVVLAAALAAGTALTFAACVWPVLWPCAIRPGRGTIPPAPVE